MTPTPIELQKYLQGVDYPVSKQQLCETAERNGAPADVLDALRGADGDDFDGPTAVSRAVS